jgi:hypothetical protein
MTNHCLPAYQELPCIPFHARRSHAWPKVDRQCYKRHDNHAWLGYRDSSSYLYCRSLKYRQTPLVVSSPLITTLVTIPMSSPIRVALIGLSKNASASWAARAHLPYLLSPRGREKYLIVALLNRSVDSAKAAIQAFDLPSSVKAYGSPEDLAKDPDIDLVVACTRVDTHYETALPSLQAGKNVFIEWPVAQNAEKVTELAGIAKDQHVRSIVDIQGRKSAVALKLREVIEKGTIGKVLNVEARIASPGSKRDAVPDSLDYFVNKEVGGNPITIAYAHSE